jgi:hypothetical protein
VTVGVNTNGASAAAKQLSALRTLDPGKWRARVRAALSTAEGHVGDYAGKSGAASRLGVHEMTLFRWLREDRELREVPTANAGMPPRQIKGRKKRDVEAK